MAANGNGGLELSSQTDRTVLNVDLGGGKSKLALISHGHVLETAAINVGGRLVAFDAAGAVSRIEPAARLVAESLGIELRLGQQLDLGDQRRMGEALAGCLFEVIRREPLGKLAQPLILTPCLSSVQPVGNVTFSGGVSEYPNNSDTPYFGDLAPPPAAATRDRIARDARPPG